MSLLGLQAIVVVTKDFADMFQQTLGLGKIGARVHNGLAMYKNIAFFRQNPMSSGVAWKVAIAADARYWFIPSDKRALRFIRRSASRYPS